MRPLDTNILLYAISTSPDERGKAAVALALLDEPDVVIPVQALQEFYVQATRKSRSDAISYKQAENLLESWRRFYLPPLTSDIVFAAMKTCRQFQIAYWDAAIIEAARAARCHQVLSEDLQHGMNFDGVTVVNPFRP
jgi:predicted nucleic acid-binding protein